MIIVGYFRQLLFKVINSNYKTEKSSRQVKAQERSEGEHAPNIVHRWH